MILIMNGRCQPDGSIVLIRVAAHVGWDGISVLFSDPAGIGHALDESAGRSVGSCRSTFNRNHASG